MKKLIVIAALTVSAVGASVAIAASYTVFPTLTECKAAAKAAVRVGETVADCHLADGGWTYNPPKCQDGQCLPD